MDLSPEQILDGINCRDTLAFEEDFDKTDHEEEGAVSISEDRQK